MPATTPVSHQRLEPVPSRPGHFLFGVYPEFRRDPLGLFINAAREQGDVVKLRFGPYTNYLVSHPDGIQHVLQANHRNYRRAPFANDILKYVSGLNLVTSDGDFWRRQRRLMQPAFHHRRIAGFGKIIVDATLSMIDNWKTTTSKDATVDICDEMTRLTMRIVGLALFSVDLSHKASRLGRAFKVMSNYVEYRINAIIPQPQYLPTRRNREIKRSLNDMNHILREIIAERRKSPKQHDDLMSMLMDARHEDSNEGMSDSQICNEMIAMIGAGYETVASALPWTFYLLSQHSNIEDVVFTKLKNTLNDAPPTINDMDKLGFLGRIFDETLRLYPPFWSLTVREAISTDVIGNYQIPAEASVVIVPYAVHRDPRFWANADKFDPERFMPEASVNRHKFAYLPFGGGPRQCIGNMFALTEALLILATILQYGRLRLASDQIIKPDSDFVLRIKGGLPMIVEPHR